MCNLLEGLYFIVYCSYVMFQFFGVYETKKQQLLESSSQWEEETDAKEA